jgi:quercetin dioxygenase-like cupin family protein
MVLCDVLNVPVADLFRTPDSHLVRWADAPTIDLGGVSVTDRLVSPRHDSRFQVVRTVVAPGTAGNGGDDLYTVSADVELIHVIRGTVRVSISSDSWELAAGDSLTLDGREPHTWAVADADGAEILWVLVPAAWGDLSGRVVG